MTEFDNSKVSSTRVLKEIAKRMTMASNLSDKEIHEIMEQEITRVFWEQMVYGTPDQGYESITLPKISQYNPYGDIHKKIEGWLK